VGKKRVPLLKKGKHKKHDAIVNDFDAQKEKHLEKLASKQIDEMEKFSRLKEKNIKTDFFKLF
jgi:ribosome recycling factor